MRKEPPRLPGQVWKISVYCFFFFFLSLPNCDSLKILIATTPIICELKITPESHSSQINSRSPARGHGRAVSVTGAWSLELGCAVSGPQDPRTSGLCWNMVAGAIVQVQEAAELGETGSKLLSSASVTPEDETCSGLVPGAARR